MVAQRVVLVVDDEQLVRQVKREILLHAGCIVFEAEGAEEAIRLAAVHTGTIDVLVTDLSLPGLQGADLAVRLRALRPGLGVVFTSGYLDDGVPGTLVPGSVFLQKPFALDELTAAVDAVATA